MNKRIQKFAAFMLASACALGAGGCRQTAVVLKNIYRAGFPLPYVTAIEENEHNVYDGDKFYHNNAQFSCADPGAAYFSREEIEDSYSKLLAREKQLAAFDESVFVEKYGTSAEWAQKYAEVFYVAATGGYSTDVGAYSSEYPDAWFTTFRLWSSDDLNNWKLCGDFGGSAFIGTHNTWASKDLVWAPEIIRDEESGLFLMFFSCAAVNGDGVNGLQKTDDLHDRLQIGVACSVFPTGPYSLIDGEKYYSSLAALNADGTPATIQKDGKTYALYRDDIKKNEILTEVKDGKFLNRNGMELTCMVNPFNFGVYAPQMVTRDPNPAQEGTGIFANIDASPFVDSKGNKYVYMVEHISSVNNTNRCWVIGMDDWLTPKYETLKKVADVNGSAIFYDETAPIGGVESALKNGSYLCEGPYVVEHEGWFYLTYAPDGYGRKSYAVCVAVANNPYGPFVKMREYSPAIGMSGMGTLTGTGHCSFVKAGKELYCVYHAIDSPSAYHWRALAVDKVVFKTYDNLSFSAMIDEQAEAADAYYASLSDEQKQESGKRDGAFVRNCFATCNGTGYEPTTDTDIVPVMYGNGPTYTVMPLPDSVHKDGKRNVVLDEDAKVVLSDGEKSTEIYADDELISSDDKSAKYEVWGRHSLRLEITFENPKRIDAIMIFNSMNYMHAFRKVSSIVFKLAEKPSWYPQGKLYNGYCYIEDLPVNADQWDDGKMLMNPCSSANAVFNEITVTEIDIYLTSEDKIAHDEELFGYSDDFDIAALSEVYVLGKEAEIDE